MAERIAEGVRGVRGVKNDLLVDYSAQRADPEISAHVRSRLRSDALLNDGLIDVQVKDGKVTLGGAVASAAERRRAASDAWVTGVKGVDIGGLAVSWWAKQNDLKKNKLLWVSDADIRSAILSSVACDPRVRSAGVQVDVDRRPPRHRGLAERENGGRRSSAQHRRGSRRQQRAQGAASQTPARRRDSESVASRDTLGSYMENYHDWRHRCPSMERVSRLRQPSRTLGSGLCLPDRRDSGLYPRALPRL